METTSCLSIFIFELSPVVLQAVEAGCVLVLLQLVTAASAGQACAAAAALMMVSLSKQAKVALHEVSAHILCFPAALRLHQQKAAAPNHSQKNLTVLLKTRTFAACTQHCCCLLLAAGRCSASACACAGCPARAAGAAEARQSAGGADSQHPADSDQPS